MPVLSQSGLYSDSVLPNIRKVPAESIAVQFTPLQGFQPQSVSLDEAAGGFNSVIEVAASSGLRAFRDVLTLPDLWSQFTGRRLQDFLQQHGHTLLLFVGQSPPIVADELYRFAVDFSPVRSDLDIPHHIRVTFQGAVMLTEAPSWDNPPPLLGPVGMAELVVRCEYRAVIDSQRKQVDVVADMTTATVQWNLPEGLVQDIFTDFFRGGQSVADYLLSHPSVHLTPGISLVGRNPANVAVPELNRFDVEVSHVSAVINLVATEAFVVAFNLKPSVNGVMGEVQHFIGDHDYGLISDEYLIERVFKHKWNHNGFERQFILKQPITVTRDDAPEEASLEGTMTLDTLGFVVVDTDSNTRTDFIRIGGTATTQAQRIVLADGTVLGPDEVDFGSPQGHPWSVATSISTSPSPSADAQVRVFQERAQQDAYQHITRPFRHPIAELPAAVEITYTRTEGVSKQIFVLGNLNQQFFYP